MAPRVMCCSWRKLRRSSESSAPIPAAASFTTPSAPGFCSATIWSASAWSSRGPPSENSVCSRIPLRSSASKKPSTNLRLPGRSSDSIQSCSVRLMKAQSGESSEVQTKWSSSTSQEKLSCCMMPSSLERTILFGRLCWKTWPKTSNVGTMRVSLDATLS